jgi:hypothetical protein
MPPLRPSAAARRSIRTSAHGHEDVAVIEERAAQPGPAINLRAMPCGGNGEANRRALVNEKPWTYKTGPRYACCCDDIGLGGRYEPETILV